MKKITRLAAVLCAAVLFTPVAHAQENLYVGSNSSGVTTDFTSGTNAYANTFVGYEPDADSNTLNVLNTNTVLTNSDSLTVGGSGSGNSLVISNGGTVAADNSLNLGQSAGSDSNSVVVTGTGSSLAVGNAFIGTANGAGNTGNTLEVSAGGSLTSLNVILGGSSNSVLVTGSGSTLTNSAGITVGTGSFFGVSSTGNSLVIANGGKVASVAVYNDEFRIGYDAGDNQNSVTVTGAGSLLTNGGDVIVGVFGSSNSLVVSGGGTVANASGFIGLSGTDNTALVTGAGSLWTNSGTLTVGGFPFSGAAGGTLTVASGGTVAAAGGITIAAQAGDTGTLNIGRFGTNDAVGTIITPTIAFGAGTGAINFNQSDATTITAAISGNGAVKQLGAGTTTLSASNTYTGDTTISAGTLRFSTENGAGGSRILQTTMASLVEFLGGGRMTNQMTAFQYSFAESFEAAGQVTLADAASSISVASGKTVTGSGQFTGTGGLTKKGLGTLSLTAANNFSGPVAVQSGLLNLNASSGAAAASISSVSVASGATLLLSRSDQVNNGATVSLSGGTIRRGGNVGEVFGNLNLTQASFLDFGTGAAGNLTFGTYAPSALLTINNFLPGNTLVFGSDLRSSITNSSLFSFSNGGIGSSSWNQSTSTFTITAIPEPSTYVAALGLLALMLWPLRRKRSA